MFTLAAAIGVVSHHVTGPVNLDEEHLRVDGSMPN